MMVFCNFIEIEDETKKLVRVKVVPFGVLYSCVKFRRLKMGDPVLFCPLGAMKLGVQQKKVTASAILVW